MKQHLQFTVSDIAGRIGARVAGDPARMVAGVAPFESATAGDIVLASSPKYLKNVHQTAAEVIVADDGVEVPGKTIVQSANPQSDFARIVSMFHPPVRPEPGISSSAVVGKGFVCGEGVSIGHHVVVGDRVTLGDAVDLRPGVVIGDDVAIGSDTVIYPNVTICNRCRIGSRVVIHSGTVIGSEGFGFAPDGEGHIHLPHIGSVEIGDDAEIGANCTIDRGKFGITRVGCGVKTDNLVHIGHNVEVGDHSLIVAQVGISGSVRIGHHAILAGQAGVAQHLVIGDRAIVGPQAGLAKDVEPGEVISGSPGIPHRTWLRVQRVLPQLPELKKTIHRIQKQMDKLGKKNHPRTDSNGNIP